jgi:hypothetical protein
MVGTPMNTVMGACCSALASIRLQMAAGLNLWAGPHHKVTDGTRLRKRLQMAAGLNLWAGPHHKVTDGTRLRKRLQMAAGLNLWAGPHHKVTDGTRLRKRTEEHRCCTMTRLVTI